VEVEAFSILLARIVSQKPLICVSDWYGGSPVSARLAWSMVLLITAACVGHVVAADADPLLTVAEKTDYKATSRHQDVVDFCSRLAKASPKVRLGDLGTSTEGRKLPLVILADPPIATAAEARASKK